jgi:tetratricopeptide (TPR) repeat protein
MLEIIRGLDQCRAVAAILVLVISGAACSRNTPEGTKESGPAELRSTTADGRVSPWLKNLGKFERKITTSSPEAQRFFNQGLTLYYGFNHQEAVRSFQEAARLDPQCAMAYWGEALSLGPNINDAFPDEEREQQAYAAMQKARKLKTQSNETEQALIEALTPRYTATHPKDRKPLNVAYAKAMTGVYRRFPDDPDVATLYAEAVMDTMPWSYWTRDGRPQPGTKELVAALESVLEKHPDHPGAHHLYIHAVEASPDPDRAVPSADKLGGLVPAAGHLVHMPSHIYIRVGRYEDAVTANQRAILADEDYITQCRAQGIYPVGYYPHNIHFLSFALSATGRAREAIESARKAAEKTSHVGCGMQGLGFVHLLQAYPLFALVRFGQWDEIVKEASKPVDSPFVKAMQHFARGLAYNAKGDLDKAEADLAALKAALADGELAKLTVNDQNTLLQLSQVATELLAGEVAAKRGDFKRAVAHLRRGVAFEDRLIYSEPPDWPQPVRQSLGAVLLEGGHAAEAEKVYREDLKRHRDNGWSLFGLMKSLEAQGKTDEAAAIKEKFHKAWGKSDVTLTASRL